MGRLARLDRGAATAAAQGPAKLAGLLAGPRLGWQHGGFGAGGASADPPPNPIMGQNAQDPSRRAPSNCNSEAVRSRRGSRSGASMQRGLGGGTAGTRRGRASVAAWTLESPGASSTAWQGHIEVARRGMSRRGQAVDVAAVGLRLWHGALGRKASGGVQGIEVGRRARSRRRAPGVGARLSRGAVRLGAAAAGAEDRVGRVSGHAWAA